MAMIGNYLFVYDSEGEYPIIRLDVDTGEWLGISGWGRGPGETLKGGNLYISSIKDTLVVYNSNGFNLLLFDVEGKLLRSRNSLAFGNSYVIGIQDNLFRAVSINMLLMSTDSVLIESYRYDEKGIVKLPTNSYIPFEEHPDLEIFALNQLTRQGPYAVDAEGRMYLGNFYSSLLLGLDAGGTLLFKTYEPDKIPIPKILPEKGKNGVSIKSPGPMTHTEITMGLAVDSQYVYALHSGVEPSFLKNIKSILDIGSYNINEGKKLRLFDKFSGKFIHEVELPFWAVDIHADEEHFYFIRWDKKSSYVQKISKSELLSPK